MHRLFAILSLCLLALCLLAGCGEADSKARQPGGSAGANASTTVATFHADGRLERPRGYRTWVHVGSPLTPNDMNNGKAAFPEFHTVYIDPQSYDAYKQTGEWRDGAMLVKELTSVGSKEASSGQGYFQGEFTGVEVAMKSADRFADEPGNWGYFRFTDEEAGRAMALGVPQATSSCAACHLGTAGDDMVFTQYYPVLRAAKNSGNTTPEDQ